jgi:hypothetical protein
MARTFGITSTAAGITATVINGVTRSESAEIAEARNASGAVTDRQAYSRTKTAEISGLVDGTISVEAGDKVTAGGITDGLITNLAITESNTDYQQFSATVETKDSAVNVALA